MRRKKRRERTRSRKHLDAAWAAIESEDHERAIREAQRALTVRQDDPVLWNDFGVILESAGRYFEAEQQIRNAILIAPQFAEGFMNLARVVARQGRTRQALRAIEEAVRLDDTNSAYVQLFEQYRVLAPAEGDPDTEFDIPYPTGEPRDLPRFERFDWAALGSELLAEGIVKVERVLTPEECDELIRLFTHDAAFERRKVVSDSRGSGLEYAFFRTPFLEIVDRVRANFYRRLVR
ncbi:MAG: tetratricopeptide repeat protein, partial [Planctomycetota bacterium]